MKRRCRPTTTSASRSRSTAGVSAPGYGALHRGVGLRRRHNLNFSAVGAWTLLAVAGLSLVGVLTGTNP